MIERQYNQKCGLVTPCTLVRQDGARRSPSLSTFCRNPVLSSQAACPQKNPYSQVLCPRPHTPSVILQNFLCSFRLSKLKSYNKIIMSSGLRIVFGGLQRRGLNLNMMDVASSL